MPPSPNASAHREPPRCGDSASAEPQHGGDAVARIVSQPSFLSDRGPSLLPPLSCQALHSHAQRKVGSGVLPAGCRIRACRCIRSLPP
jgi:hypothetical protein